jgi:hypothetical protein
MYANQDQLRAAYGKVPAITNDYAETIFSDVQKIQKTGKKMMELTAILHHDYPEKMMPLVSHHYSEKSKFFSLENITHYLQTLTRPSWAGTGERKVNRLNMPTQAHRSVLGQGYTRIHD